MDFGISKSTVSWGGWLQLRLDWEGELCARMS